MKNNFNHIAQDKSRYKDIVNDGKFYFQNGDTILSSESAYNLSIVEIADIINTSCQEVCNQINLMVIYNSPKVHNI